MELFKEINYIQNFGSISINRGVFKNNSSWLDHVKEIELKNYNNVDINIYSHYYLDLGILQNRIFEDYISNKNRNKFLTVENYIQRFIWWNISVLENILFSKNKHEECYDRITQKLELINFPKHFVSISDELIYTIEKRGAKEYNYIFLKGFENKDESFQKDYFLNLYKFLSEELPILLKEIDENNNSKTTQNQNDQSIVEFYLNDFKDEGKFDDNNYSVLVNSLNQFIKFGTLPFLENIIEFTGNKKRLGWAINCILKKYELKINYAILKFAQNNISKFKNNNEIFDETNFRDTYIYKLFTDPT